MAERDRAAVDVQLLGIDRQFLQAGEHLRGKGLVELERSIWSSVRPASLSTLRIAGTGPMPKRSGSTPAVAKRDEAGQRRQAALAARAPPT